MASDYKNAIFTDFALVMSSLLAGWLAQWHFRWLYLPIRP